MAKKQAYYDQAEKMYIEQGVPLSGIAKKLEITEKTLGAWKTEGDWERKRAHYLKTKNSSNTELHKMIANLSRQVNDDIEAGNRPDPQLIYSISGLANIMLKLKTYEDAIVKEETEKKEDKGASTEEILTQVHDILGIN